MRQKILTFLVLALILAMLGIVILGSQNKKKLSVDSFKADSAKIVLYFGNTCPHCEELEKWMKEKKIEEKLEIVKKEVYDNRENALELSNKAESCGLNKKEIGVPFLFAEGKCFLGSLEIRNYLSEKANL